VYCTADAAKPDAYALPATAAAAAAAGFVLDQAYFPTA